MKRRIKKIVAWVAAVVVCLMLIVSVTYLWLSATSSKTNPFAIPLGGIEVVEVFTPVDDWKPGQSITKEVGVANTGDGEILARVYFEEMLSLLNIPASATDMPDMDGYIPQLCNSSVYDNAPWQTIQGAGLAISGLPADVEVRVNKVVVHVGTPSEKVSYAFVAWHPLTGGVNDGKSQRVTADFTVSSGQVTAGNVHYWYYSGTTDVTAQWNGQEKPAAAGIDKAASDAGGQITLLYNNRADLTAAAPVAGSWWYNADDGYFYYIGKLGKGDATTNLLTGLRLSTDAPSQYDGLSFELTVHAEAIQNNVDAMTSSSGWALAPDSPVVAALSTYCVS